jgi:hypothetical protein
LSSCRAHGYIIGWHPDKIDGSPRLTRRRGRRRSGEAAGGRQQHGGRSTERGSSCGVYCPSSAPLGQTALRPPRTPQVFRLVIPASMPSTGQRVSPGARRHAAFFVASLPVPSHSGHSSTMRSTWLAGAGTYADPWHSRHAPSARSCRLFHALSTVAPLLRWVARPSSSPFAGYAPVGAAQSLERANGMNCSASSRRTNSSSHDAERGARGEGVVDRGVDRLRPRASRRAGSRRERVAAEFLRRVTSVCAVRVPRRLPHPLL